MKPRIIFEATEAEITQFDKTINEMYRCRLLKGTKRVDFFREFILVQLPVQVASYAQNFDKKQEEILFLQKKEYEEKKAEKEKQERKASMAYKAKRAEEESRQGNVESEE